jgi:hypothetical protein
MALSGYLTGKHISLYIFDQHTSLHRLIWPPNLSDIGFYLSLKADVLQLDT